MHGHNVLALDLGRRVGFAEGHLGDVPRYGVWLLKGAPDKATRERGEDHAACFVGLADILHDRFEGPDPPKEVCFEAPLVRGQHSGIAAGQLGMGFAAIVQAVCYRHGISCYQSHTSQTRKAVLGRGTFKKGEAKAAVIAWCQSQGWDPPDDNAADALILWFHVLRVRRPDAPLPTGPGTMLRDARMAPRDPNRRNAWTVPAR